ncbi:hypothetical protein KY315_04595, partial [Candidatus Woesearchaeota archaeon]|nr:hypothetical protein [Candidatus Woesearchaeota archaeon]
MPVFSPTEQYGQSSSSQGMSADYYRPGVQTGQTIRGAGGKPVYVLSTGQKTTDIEKARKDAQKLSGKGIQPLKISDTRVSADYYTGQQYSGVPPQKVAELRKIRQKTSMLTGSATVTTPATTLTSAKNVLSKVTSPVAGAFQPLVEQGKKIYQAKEKAEKGIRVGKMTEEALVDRRGAMETPVEEFRPSESYDTTPQYFPDFGKKREEEKRLGRLGEKLAQEVTSYETMKDDYEKRLLPEYKQDYASYEKDVSVLSKKADEVEQNIKRLKKIENALASPQTNEDVRSNLYNEYQSLLTRTLTKAEVLDMELDRLGIKEREKELKQDYGQLSYRYDILKSMGAKLKPRSEELQKATKLVRESDKLQKRIDEFDKVYKELRDTDFAKKNLLKLGVPKIVLGTMQFGRDLTYGTVVAPGKEIEKDIKEGDYLAPLTKGVFSAPYYISKGVYDWESPKGQRFDPIALSGAASAALLSLGPIGKATKVGAGFTAKLAAPSWKGVLGRTAVQGVLPTALIAGPEIMPVVTKQKSIAQAEADILGRMGYFLGFGATAGTLMNFPVKKIQFGKYTGLGTQVKIPFKKELFGRPIIGVQKGKLIVGTPKTISYKPQEFLLRETKAGITQIPITKSKVKIGGKTFSIKIKDIKYSKNLFEPPTIKLGGKTYSLTSEGIQPFKPAETFLAKRYLKQTRLPKKQYEALFSPKFGAQKISKQVMGAKYETTPSTIIRSTQNLNKQG